MSSAEHFVVKSATKSTGHPYSYLRTCSIIMQATALVVTELPYSCRRTYYFTVEAAVMASSCLARTCCCSIAAVAAAVAA